MIRITQGNLLEADVEVLVNAVNCVGIMGKGLALQFKKKFPNNFKIYEIACKAKQVQPGKVLVIPEYKMINPRYIINFPTKRHWRQKSQIKDIESGLQSLISEVKELEIKSIAIPALGCGNGGLYWNEVKPLIESAFVGLADVKVLLFSPLGINKI